MPLPKELLTLTVVIPTFLFITSLFPQTHALFITLWIFCIHFDIYTTYQFYIKNPNQFQNKERNKIFVWLTKKVSFKKATILFPLLIEIPILLFFALLPLQILQTYMLPQTPNNFTACITTSFGITATGHLIAAIKNTKHNHKTKHNNTLPFDGVHSFDQDGTETVPSCPKLCTLPQIMPNTTKF